MSYPSESVGRSGSRFLTDYPFPDSFGIGTPTRNIRVKLLLLICTSKTEKILAPSLRGMCCTSFTSEQHGLFGSRVVEETLQKFNEICKIFSRPGLSFLVLSVRLFVCLFVPLMSAVCALHSAVTKKHGEVSEHPQGHTVNGGSVMPIKPTECLVFCYSQGFGLVVYRKPCVLHAATLARSCWCRCAAFPRVCAILSLLIRKTSRVTVI